MATKKHYKNKVLFWQYRLIRWYVQGIREGNAGELPIQKCLEILVEHYGLQIVPSKKTIAPIIALLEVRNAPQRVKNKFAKQLIRFDKNESAIKNLIECEKPKPRLKPQAKPVKKSDKSQSQAMEFYQSWEWKKARYEALKLHGAKCQCCGATKDNAKIVVDHIKPLRFNWELRLEINNLQILCDDCNRGKSYQDETDWRDK